MLQDIITPYRGQFAPGMTTELRAQRNLLRRVVLRSGTLVTNSRTDMAGVNARVYDGGVYGFASRAELTGDAVKSVLKSATDNARFLSSKVKPGRGALPAIERGERPRDPDFTDLPQKIYIDYLKGLDAYIAEKCPNLAGRTLLASCDSMEKLISTSDGYQAHVPAPRGYVYVMLSAASKSGVPVELFRAFGGSGTFDKNFSDPALLFPEVDALYEHLMRKCEGVYADAGLKTVILNGMMSGMLAHEAVGHTVEADLVKAGSVAQGLIGETVASPLVSMVDFAHTAFGAPAPLPIWVDDEGVKAEDAWLIRDGVLTGYMTNRDLGAQMGMKPQGNARAWAFSDEPLVRMRNTAVLPGSSTLEEMISSIDDGYYIMNSTNGQADATGEFMFGVNQGYEIKHGRLGRALLDTTVSGVAFEMLKTVSMVGSEVSWSSSGFCGKKQMIPVGMGGPALKCSITIGGR